MLAAQLATPAATPASTPGVDISVEASFDASAVSISSSPSSAEGSVHSEDNSSLLENPIAAQPPLSSEQSRHQQPEVLPLDTRDLSLLRFESQWTITRTRELARRLVRLTGTDNIVYKLNRWVEVGARLSNIYSVCRIRAEA